MCRTAPPSRGSYNSAPGPPGPPGVTTPRAAKGCPYSISELAAYTGLDRTTLTRTLKPLLSQGYLQDQSLPGARNRALCLTQRGVRTLKEGLPLWRQAQSRLEEQLGQEGARWIYEVAEKL